ncbi:uncharacterized protein LOC134717962 [Mytilus trossulus]|uniref:uncharacterized protein LOC134717962 n=1 Tax=Mytilus trossulus TaxID=6551 RepID=UPI0030047D01
MTEFLACLILNIIFDITYGYDTTCPHQSHRTMRAEAICGNYSITRYQCLYTIGYESYIESCRQYTIEDDYDWWTTLGYVRLGQKFVRSGEFLFYVDCNKNRYQPFKLRSNVSSQCEIQRSQCNEIGQVIYNNGTTMDDIVCRCDYRKGFAFLSEPENPCYCIPSKEDCTCYKKQCSGLLTPDYICTKSNSAKYTCPPIMKIQRTLSKTTRQGEEKKSEIQNTKIEVLARDDLQFGVLLIFSVFICIFFGNLKTDIKGNTSIKDEPKEYFQRLQITGKEEEPKALKQSEYSDLNSRIDIQQNLKSAPTDTFYSRRTLTSPDDSILTSSTFEKTECTKNWFVDCIIDERLHALTRSSMDSFKNLKKNLLIKCNNYIVNCDVDRRLHTKIIHSDFLLKKDIRWKDLKDFEKLIYTSFHVDRKTLSSTFWILNFLPVIQNQDSNLCRFLLTIVDKIGNDKWKTCFHHLLAGLSISMRIKDKDTSKVIAWFITKKCFHSLKRPIQENIIDIWPGFLCTCQRQKEVFCIDENETKYVEITININALSPDLPHNFWNIDITYITNTTVNNAEHSQILEHLQSSSGKIHIPDKKSIGGADAKQLFNEHSNLSLIHKSPFKSTGYRKQKQKVFAQSCFQLYCKRKGIIPIGENHFPITLHGLQTDVVEGSPNYLSNLKVGNQIGTDEFKRGTLGGFVQVRGDKAFLTCLHVFLSANELASENLSLDDEKTVPVKLYRENGNSHICGKIREIAFEVDNEKETSIDAALVEIPADRIDNFDYVDIGSEKLSFRDIGMKSEYLNNSCVDYRPLCFSKPQPILQTVCVGAVSGFRNTTEPLVYENTDKSIDLESIEETYSKAILDEIKTNVKVVIQSIQQIPIAVSLDDYTIKMNIEQNCDSNISSEIKDIVIAVIKNMYSTMQCTNDVDIDRLIHEHVFCKTQSNFSAIIGDVHMQHAFLKKTGKNMAIKRTSRRVYNQIYISNIPFQPGDSGTCIYVLSPVQGCIGMAIADHPLGGCIATPIMDILKHFKIRIK